MHNVYCREIQDRLDAGVSLQAVESELIEPAHELSEEHRSALWLFAWTYRRGVAEHSTSPADLRARIS